VKRFYKEVTVTEADGGWQVKLDGRGIKTAGKRPQVVPTRALAEAMAAEWAGQAETINTAVFQFRDLADYALDVVAQTPGEVVDELLPYAETDTLCYRADPDEALYEYQQAVWEPLLINAEERLGIRFTRVSGILHKPQPAPTLKRLRQEIESRDAFTLAALKMLTSLSASLVLGLEAIRPGADAETLWKASELEADWQAELWGEDWEAAERRKARFEAFALAMHLAALTRPAGTA